VIGRHPFGDPQTVEISGVGGAVHVRWEVGGQDDLTLLGIHLGVLPEDRVMLDGAITYDEGDGALVTGSAELPAYVLDHVAVDARGQACAGEVVAVGDLTDGGGVDLAFTCPVDADRATVTVTTLTDLHPAYRTLATGPDGQRAAYGGSKESHDWVLPVAAGAASTGTRPGPPADVPDVGQSAAVQMGAVGAALLIVAVGAVALRRRLHRTPPPTSPEGELRVGTTTARHEVP